MLCIYLIIRDKGHIMWLCNSIFFKNHLQSDCFSHRDQGGLLFHLTMNLYTLLTTRNLHINVLPFRPVTVWDCSGRWFLSHDHVRVQMAGRQTERHGRCNPAQRVQSERSENVLDSFSGQGHTCKESNTEKMKVNDGDLAWSRIPA